jgi:hypothetical protein
MSFTIITEITGNNVIMRPQGDMTRPLIRSHDDIARVTDGPKALRKAILVLKPGTNLQLDMTGITQINEYGGDAIWDGYKHITENGGKMGFLGPQELTKIWDIGMRQRMIEDKCFSNIRAIFSSGPSRSNAALQQAAALASATM